MAGEIRKLGKNAVPSRPEPKILGTSEIPSGDPQILDKKTGTSPALTEVHVHEEVIVEGQDKIRRAISVAEEPDVEIRFRQAQDPKSWARVKRAED